MDDDLILYFLIVYGVMQIVLLVASAAWFFRIRHDLSIMHAKIWDINNEIVHHAVALHEAGLIPLPWEEIEEELRNFVPDTNARGNDNVYYLVDDD
tara:strand:- start:34 stop:321 length:288 start_codon:yes stop_codon:yes gene_type:complete